MGVTGLRGLDCGRKLGKMRAMCGRYSHLFGGGVVMAGQHGTKAAGLGHCRGLVRGPQPGRNTRSHAANG